MTQSSATQQPSGKNATRPFQVSGPEAANPPSEMSSFTHSENWYELELYS